MEITTDIFLQEHFWRISGLALPVALALIQMVIKTITFLRNGKVLKLKTIHKDYGEHLDAEEKNYISKLIKQRIMTQLTGVGDSIARERFIYIMNRCDLNLYPHSIQAIGKFAKFDGNRFYFTINKKFKRKRFVARAIACVYFVYAIMPGIVFIKTDGEVMPWYVAVILFILLFLLGLLLVSAYPSNKKMQGINGDLLKIDVDYFNGK